MTDANNTPLSYLQRDGNGDMELGGENIAYRANLVEGQPTIVFLHGHGSDMDGTKALVVEEWAKQQKFGCIRFDYYGHGQSSGDMMNGTVSRWKADCLAIIDHLVSGSCYLVGSSLGGWLMLLVAMARPDRMAGLIGIAAAPDFTEDLIWNDLTPDQQADMEKTGRLSVPNPYVEGEVIYPYQLITDGRDHLILDHPIPITCPVRLLQGLKDAEVPWQTANRIADAITGDDVDVLFDADADHRFSEPDQLDTLLATLAEITRKTYTKR
ncbi:MAG: alpha/beta hydrolase [Alphaproteobacteria bacterium]|nr:alpha/beta hydrolase [Alphaproteobacteria bacterium]